MRSFRHRRAHPPALLRRNRSRGLSLLEVILAITILGGSLVLVGELIRIGFRSAAEAKLQSEAQIHCDAKMAEVAAGVLPLESSGGNSSEEDPSWVYSVDIENADQIATTFSGEIGDTRNLANLIALRDKHTLGDGRMTFNDYLAETSSEIGFRVQSSLSIQLNVKELNFQYQAQRDSVSGVDINEELIDLTKHQKSYEAAIQVVRTMDAMLAELIQMVR